MQSEQIRAVIESRAFREAVQTSETRRAVVVLVVLACVLGLAVSRHIAGGDVFQSWVFPALLALIGAAALGEILLLWSAGSAGRRGELLPGRLWTGATIAEMLIPTFAIVLVQRSGNLDPVKALTAPALLMYSILIVLTVLRLRPRLCLLAGIVGALGHGVLVVLTGLQPPANSPPEAFNWPIMLSYPVLILICGIAGALTAREVCMHVATALHEAAERQRVQLVARNTLIFGLAKLAEYRDTDTGAHLDRISEYSGVLAGSLRKMGGKFASIDDDWTQVLRVASSMHDIGKVGIPDAVLCKPGRLTDEERQVIQRHPGLGSSALEQILRRHGADALLEMSVQIAACHHERWDGKGYPAGLKGEHIPLPARIIAVADVYDALTSARVYKPAMSHEEASRIIREGSATQFDPDVVEAFARAAEQFNRVRERFADARAPEPAGV